MNPIHNRYQKLILDYTISKGAFAEVYKGRIFDHSENAYRVAVKVLKKRWVDKPDLINRLEDEADLLAQLNHINIISALGFTDIEERPSIVMEYIDGIDLKTLLKHVQLPPNLCFFIGARVASALHSAYSHKLAENQPPLAVIHRDIKPSNVMLTREKGIKVLDFGASRFDHKARKGQTTIYTFGSPKYMSNERKKGDRGSHSSDIYSLGIMLIELLSGRTLSQNPPNNQQKHDRFIEHLVQRIQFQLPSPEWNKRAGQLLIRMCAFWKNHRFTAEECFQLLGAFAQHAKGVEQDLFWQKRIIPLLNQYQQEETPGALTGKTISLDPSQKTPPKQEPSFQPQIKTSKPKTIQRKEPKPADFLRTTHPPDSPHVEVFLQKEKIPDHSIPPVDAPRRSEPPAVKQEEKPPAQEYIPQEPIASPVPQKNNNYQKNILISSLSACFTFSFLHIITYSGLALSNNLHVIFPDQTENAEETEESVRNLDTENFDITLDLDAHYFISLKLLDEDDTEFALVNRKKMTRTVRLSRGTYTLIAQERTSKRRKSAQYQFTKETKIHCGAPTGDLPVCEDHNNNAIISFPEESDEDIE